MEQSLFFSFLLPPPLFPKKTSLFFPYGDGQDLLIKRKNVVKIQAPKQEKELDLSLHFVPIWNCYLEDSKLIFKKFKKLISGLVNFLIVIFGKSTKFYNRF